MQDFDRDPPFDTNVFAFVHRAHPSAADEAADTVLAVDEDGYGDCTSYQCPGGLNLGQIAPVPVK
jgi:hypothetical protein